MIRQTAAGVELDIRVIPRARKTELSGVRDDAVLVRVAAPPIDNAANLALIEFFSAIFHLPRRSVSIVSGEHRRHKRVAIQGVTLNAVKARLAL